MKVSVTGTLSVSRKEFEKMVANAGHELIEFSTKATEVLIVGEKTASDGKVAKAEKAGIRIVKEADPAKFFSTIGGGYRDHYVREEVIMVGTSEVLEIFRDFAMLNADQGEWRAEDARHCLEEMDGAKKYLLEGLKVCVATQEEDVFWKAFRRWLVLEYINSEYCEGTGVKITSRQLGGMEDEEFNKKTLSLEFIDFSAEEREEYQEGVDEEDVLSVLSMI